MTEPGAFFVPDDETTVTATELARGPWDERFLHGGPPCALLAGAIERYPGAEDFVVARIAWDFWRPVPLDRLSVSVEPERLGRSVQRLRAVLSHEGTRVLEARGLRARRQTDAGVADPPLDPWPAPESVARHVFTFFSHPVGYHQAVDFRFVHAPWGATPVQVWGRPLVPLVAGRATSALERVVVLADAQSGMGPPLDPLRFNYPNPDLAVFLDRFPEGEWVGFDVRSSAQVGGVGLSQALIRDARGACGRSAQTLLVSRRTDG